MRDGKLRRPVHLVRRSAGPGLSSGRRPCADPGNACCGRTRQRRRVDRGAGRLPRHRVADRDGRPGQQLPGAGQDGARQRPVQGRRTRSGGQVTLTDIAPQAATAPPDPAAGEDSALVQWASWPARAGALGLDVLPGAAVLATTALVALTVPLHGGWWWASVSLGAAAVLWTGFIRLLLPGASGQSLGRRVFGITLVHPDGSAVGPVRLLLRDAAHLLDTAPVFLGWLWPLKDSRRRTFADMISGTETRVMPASGAVRRSRRAAVVVLIAAALCA